jgi:hypothetical protein
MSAPISAKKPTQSEIDGFVRELEEFAFKAEQTLKKIEEDLEGNRGLFSHFSESMFTIRGTAVQLGFPQIAEIAELGEELALKGQSATQRAHIRRCVAALWDAQTTVKYLIVHHDRETGDEQQILMNRLQAMLSAFGGARPKVDQDEIEALLRNRN